MVPIGRFKHADKRNITRVPPQDLVDILKAQGFQKGKYIVDGVPLRTVNAVRNVSDRTCLRSAREVGCFELFCRLF